MKYQIRKYQVGGSYGNLKTLFDYVSMFGKNQQLDFSDFNKPSVDLSQMKSLNPDGDRVGVRAPSLNLSKIPNTIDDNFKLDVPQKGVNLPNSQNKTSKFANFSGNFSQFSQKNGGIANTIGSIGKGLTENDVKYTGKNAEVANKVSGVVTQINDQINPMGSAVGKLGATVGNLIGGTKDRVKGTGSAVVETVGNVASYFGPIGMAVSAALNIANGIGGHRVDKLADNTKDISAGAYSGTVSDIRSSIDQYSNKKAGLFDFGFSQKGNRKIREATRLQDKTLGITRENNLRKSTTYCNELASQIYNRYLGNSGSNMVIGKKGMKFPELETSREILKKITLAQSEENLEIIKFAEGGKMNVIAEGAYHSRKNNLESVNEDLVDVTKKGIPVIAYEEGGEITQTAEIEEGELILTKEITDKIEKLYKDGSEEAMIEAGKLLANELMNNTDDRTNKILDNEDTD